MQASKFATAPVPFLPVQGPLNSLEAGRSYLDERGRRVRIESGSHGGFVGRYASGECCTFGADGRAGGAMSPAGAVRLMGEAIDLPEALADLPWMTRTVTVLTAPETQYLVMCADGRNCYASGTTPAAAARAAARRYEFEKIQPVTYSPRLAGFRFGIDELAPGPIVMHTCIAPDGRVMGRADGRLHAARRAVAAVVSELPPHELSFEEFQLISFQAQIVRGVGARHRRAVYADLDEMNEVRAALRWLWDSEPVRQGEPRTDFVKRMTAEILELPALQAGAAHYALPLGQGVIHLIFHHGSNCSGDPRRRIWEALREAGGVPGEDAAPARAAETSLAVRPRQG